MTTQTLGQLKTGDAAIIVALHHQLPSVRHKYIARGLVPGARIAILRHGDPLVVALDHSRWAIDLDDARGIEVAALEPQPARKRWWRRAHQPRPPQG